MDDHPKLLCDQARLEGHSIVDIAFVSSLASFHAGDQACAHRDARSEHILFELECFATSLESVSMTS